MEMSQEQFILYKEYGGLRTILKFIMALEIIKSVFIKIHFQKIVRTIQKYQQLSLKKVIECGQTY
jgi:hypothetical protein